MKIRRNLLSLLITFLSLFILNPGWAEKLEREAYYRQVDDLDAAFKYDEAIKLLDEANKAYPKDGEILSRMSREYTLSMSDTEDEAEKIKRGQKAIQYALLALEVAPENAKSHICAAICYGRLATLMDAKTKLAYSRDVKKYAERAKELDPKNDLPWHVLGVWNYEISSLNPILRALAGTLYGKVPEASYEDAAKQLEKALALNPKRVGNYIELGRTYLALNRKGDAKKLLEKGLAMPLYDHDDDEAKRRAREALAKL